MFTLSELKKTKVYQEALAEGKEIGKLETIPNMIRLGVSLEIIAKYLDLPLEEVERFAKQIKKGD